MKTRVLKVSRENPEPELIRIAARVLQQGGLVAFPTETVYGLGADALNPKAVRKIFKVKGRPPDNPLIVHISDGSMLNLVASSVSKDARLLMRIYWPGPLTLIFRKSSKVPPEVTAGLQTVAVRMPSHPVAKALIQASGVPVAAPSANLSGKPSPTISQDVVDDLQGKVPVIIDSGITDIGIESTVVDLTKRPYTLLRPGGVPLESLRSHIDVRLHSRLQELNATDIPESPGMKYRHYAPKAKVIVLRGKTERLKNALNELSDGFRLQGLKVGVLSPFHAEFSADLYIIADEGKEQFANILFKSFREFDRKGMDIILVAGVIAKGIGRAVMNRLEKASIYRVIDI